jgi:hypothetical protein
MIQRFCDIVRALLPKLRRPLDQVGTGTSAVLRTAVVKTSDGLAHAFHRLEADRHALQVRAPSSLRRIGDKAINRGKVFGT